MRNKFFATSFFTVALLATALLLGQLNIRAAVPDSNQVSQLLEDIKMQAADLQRDSDELESFTHSNVSWESHAEELEHIKERVNAIGKTIQKLKDLRPGASPWQKEAIDRIIPHAQQLASNTSSAIEHLNKNRLHFQDAKYQEYLKSNAEAASNLAALVRDLVEYGKAKKTLEVLEERLELKS